MLVELLRGRDRCQDLPGALLDAPFAGGVHVTSRAAGCQCTVARRTPATHGGSVA
jgi:hypothetical protein